MDQLEIHFVSRISLGLKHLVTFLITFTSKILLLLCDPDVTLSLLTSQGPVDIDSESGHPMGEIQPLTPAPLPTSPTYRHQRYARLS